MPLKTECLKWGDGEIELTISEASILIGAQRSIYIFEQQELSKKDISPAKSLLRWTTYPSLVAATVSAKGLDPWPIPFDRAGLDPKTDAEHVVFIELPEKFVRAWEEIVFRLNSHWLPSVQQEKKKEPKEQPTSSPSG